MENSKKSLSRSAPSWKLYEIEFRMVFQQVYNEVSKSSVFSSESQVGADLKLVCKPFNVIPFQ